MSLRIPFSALAMTAAITLLAAGCATKSGTATQAATPVPAAQAPAAPAAPAAPPVPEGMGYEELTGVLGNGNEKRVRQELVGKTVALNLVKAKGRGVPAGHYEVDDTDATYFRCRTAAPGFAGGEISTKVSGYRFVTKAKQKIIDLERCAPAEPAPRTAAAPAATPAPAAAPQPAAPARASGGAAKAGMDAQGNVVDSSKVEAGSGRTVKGLNDYEGEITGTPAANSKFARLQIGMPVRQVTDLAGQPTDQGAYITGKAWIPFYFGSDRHRFEMTYKGQGRLIFAGGGMGDFSNGHLIWIIHNPNEAGYR